MSNRQQTVGNTPGGPEGGEHTPLPHPAARGKSVTGIPAFITAGGRLKGELAERVGTDLKALIPVRGVPVLGRIIESLRSCDSVGTIVVVGPKNELEGMARDAGADVVLPEGDGGVENLVRGFAAYRDVVGDGQALFVASDLPFLESEAISDFLKLVQGIESDILYPIVPKKMFETAYPGVPKTYARLAEGEFTGASVLRMKPEAILRNRPLIEQVFAARKNTMGMARLLGIWHILRFAIGRLTIGEAEARASVLTGCRCIAMRDADHRIAYDMDDLADYQYAMQRLDNHSERG